MSSSGPGTWNYTLDDTSPVFRYKPYSDGIGLTNGWQAWYSVSGFLTSPGEGPGSGNSYHITSLQSASVQLSFFGTGISLAGLANCTYDVVLDGTQKSIGAPSFNTLFSEYDLDNGMHNISLTLQSTSDDQVLQFDGAQITSPIPDPNSQSEPSILRIDNHNTSMITYQGNWTTHMDGKVPTSDNPAPYFQTSSSGASASMNFTGRAVEIRGISNWGWWQYIVNLDGKIISGMNASSFWIIPDAVLFYQDGLDESTVHELTITNSAGDGMDLALNSVNVFQFSKSLISSSSNSSTSVLPSTSIKSSAKLSSGKIAGITIGAFVGVTLVAAAIFWFCLRKYRHPAQTPPWATQSTYTNEMTASDSQDPIMTEAMQSASTVQELALVPTSPFSLEQNDGQSRVYFGASIFASTAATSSYPRSPTMPSEYMPTLPPHSTSHVQNIGNRKEAVPVPSTHSTESHSQSADVDHIANVVAERLASCFETLDNPPPHYDRS